MRKVLADHKEDPRLRRWVRRGVLFVICAIVVAYLPHKLFAADPKTEFLRRQLAELAVTEQELLRAAERKVHEIDALRNDPTAIEARARRDLGMVYGNERVVKVVYPAASASERPHARSGMAPSNATPDPMRGNAP